MATDIYATITQSVIAAMETATGEYTCPWHTPAASQSPRNAVSKHYYRGANVISLWIVALKFSFEHSLWATYKQWQQIGGQVRAGEKGTQIFFYKRLEVTDRKSEQGDTKIIPLVRHCTVFNIAQVDGVEVPASAPRAQLFEPSPEIDTIVSATGIAIKHIAGSGAFYLPSEDLVVMPSQDSFVGTDTSTAFESYYSVLLHECVHASGATHRLSRPLTTDRSTDAYAFEELVAELGAAFACARLGISASPRADHAQYIKHYYEILKSDSRAIFKAATAAAAACDFLLSSTAQELVGDAA
jgi:antirestriction protein ArdC